MYTLTALSAAAILAHAVNGQAATEILGNWYTNAVDAIQYTNFGSSGSYNQVTNMDSTSGTCSSVPFAYSGSLAPLNDEISVHARGPFALKQFAFYSPGSASKKEKRSVAHNHKRHGHAHFHEEKKRDVGDMVTAVIDGKTVSWVNMWDGTGVATAVPGAAPPAETPAASSGDNTVNDVAGAVANAVHGHHGGSSSSSNSNNSPESSPSYSGDYVRSAYYDSASQTAQGITFLNHMGGQGSGVFDYVFGNSLSYASSNAQSGSASSEILQDTTIPSNTEFVIMTDKDCSGDSCGYYRPGSVAKHGFSGASKVFLFEFSMPSDGTTGFNADMPALWFLNANIPRTLQYGNPTCSSWTTGGGEFDILEILDSGNTRGKSTFHGNIAGGDSAYFNRPTGAPIKLAVVMSDYKATIKTLDDSYDFSQSLTNDQVASLLSTNSLAGSLGSSIFALGG